MTDEPARPLAAPLNDDDLRNLRQAWERRNDILRRSVYGPQGKDAVDYRSLRDYLEANVGRLLAEIERLQAALGDKHKQEWLATYGYYTELGPFVMPDAPHEEADHD